MWDMYPMERFKVLNVNGLDVLCVWRGTNVTDSGYEAIRIV